MTSNARSGRRSAWIPLATMRSEGNGHARGMRQVVRTIDELVQANPCGPFEFEGGLRGPNAPNVLDIAWARERGSLTLERDRFARTFVFEVRGTNLSLVEITDPTR